MHYNPYHRDSKNKKSLLQGPQCITILTTRTPKKLLMWGTPPHVELVVLCSCCSLRGPLNGPIIGHDMLQEPGRNGAFGEVAFHLELEGTALRVSD